MGATFTTMIRGVLDKFGSKQQRILLLGLDAAGKTTILYRLNLGETIHTLPTIGFNVETVKYKNIEFTMWDVGGQDKIRPLWKHYFAGTDGLIWVVDSADHARLDLACEELHKVCSEDLLRNACVLVLSNKTDLPEALGAEAIAQGLNLRGLSQNQWYVQPCCGKNGDGLYEGLDKLAEMLS